MMESLKALVMEVSIGGVRYHTFTICLSYLIQWLCVSSINTDVVAAMVVGVVLGVLVIAASSLSSYFFLSAVSSR